MGKGSKAIDARRWMGKRGGLPVGGTIERYRRALLIAQCIEFGGPLPLGTVMHSLIGCRRRPDGAACRGTLLIAKTPADLIHACCSTCNVDEVIIDHWRDTPWANGPPDAWSIQPHTVPEVSPAVRERIAEMLEAMGSQLGVDDVIDLMVLVDEPGLAVQAIAERELPENEAAVQPILDLVMLAWNATPRPELGDKSPAELYGQPTLLARAIAPLAQGVDDLCSCGSGRTYRTCCGSN